MSHKSDLIETDILAYLRQHERKELLRFLTCGSVDDGKSTLIGRLLYDSKMVYEDQLAAVRADTARHGTVGDREFDPALLTDGLKAEREQGITIDVAYRYFSTARRKFIIADTPGHEQYTRNMATGASTCDLAIILIDARNGVMTQTRRHSFIASLLGIRHIVVAVNKMDLVGYDEAVYDRIVADYRAFAAKLDAADIQFVPISALEGDNVVHPSDHMPWYTGSTLMHILENVHIASDRNLIDFRFPVQYVVRPHLDFRGFAGTIASGVVRVGDEVVALPSGKRSRVQAIVTRDGDRAEAFAGQAPVLTLEDEIDVSRGDMLCPVNNVPRVDTVFEAMVVWMAEAPLVPNRSYLIKHTTRKVPGAVARIRYRIDVNTMHRQPADTLALNEIGRCVVELSAPIAFDPYKKNRSTGAFILIDRLTNNTVAAGMILDTRGADLAAGRRAFRDRLAEGARCHDSLVTPAERAQRLGHRPATVWLTGRAGAGKTTIAYALERRLFDEGCVAQVLDGRNLRLGLSRDLAFTDQDRAENLRRAGEVARLLNDAGMIAVCAFLSPRVVDREAVRRIVGPDRFLEVYLDTPEAECRRRAARHPDPGSLRPYGDPDAPFEGHEGAGDADLVLPTHEWPVDACVRKILDALAGRGLLEKR